MNTAPLIPTAQLTLCFRTKAPRSAEAQAALRFAVAQLAGTDHHQVHIVTPLSATERLTLALPAQRALAILALHAAADPAFDQLQLADMLLAEGQELQAHYFGSGTARERNRAAICVISQQALTAIHQGVIVSRAEVDAIIDERLAGAAQQSISAGSANALPAVVPLVMHVLCDALLSADLSDAYVLSDDLSPLAPAVSASELARLMRDSGIEASPAEIGRLAEAINSAIAFQLNVPHPQIDRQRMAGVRVKLAAYFSLEELQTLCFDLGVDYEELPGATKSGKARELVAFCARHDRVEPLLALSRRLRPHVLW